MKPSSQIDKGTGNRLSQHSQEVNDDIPAHDGQDPKHDVNFSEELEDFLIGERG